MSLLGYFNSLRELGGTRRLIEDELTVSLPQFGQKRGRIGDEASPFDDREIDKEVRELTSRYGTDQVAAAKDALQSPLQRQRFR